MVFALEDEIVTDQLKVSLEAKIKSKIKVQFDKLATNSPLGKLHAV